MKCPYCGKDMAEGYVCGGLNNRDGAYWRPRTKGFRDWMARHYNEAITLSDGYLGKGQAWYCPDCGKIVIEVAERTEEGSE